MPRRLVLAVWRERFGSLNPFIYELNKTNPAFAPRRTNWKRLGDAFTSSDPDHQIVFNRISKEFAQVFSVSGEAMRIRLQNLGLLLRDIPQQYSLMNSI
jgi:hypothetical protein